MSVAGCVEPARTHKSDTNKFSARVLNGLAVTFSGRLQTYMDKGLDSVTLVRYFLPMLAEVQPNRTATEFDDDPECAFASARRS